MDYGLAGGESGLRMRVPGKGGSVTFDSLLKPKAILTCEPGTEQSLAPTVQISNLLLACEERWSAVAEAETWTEIASQGG